MFKLKFADIKSREFMQAYLKLINFNEFKETKVAYNVAKIDRKFQQELKLSQDLYVKLIKQYAVLDDKGEIACRIENETAIPNTYVIDPAKVEAWEVAVKEFDATEFEIPCQKLTLANLEGIQLSPNDFNAIEAMIVDEA